MRLGVATRPGYPRERLDAVLAQARAPRAVHFFDTQPIPVASRELRARARARRGRPRSCRPPRSGQLIERDGLYGRGYTDARLTSIEQAHRIAALAQEKLAKDVVILDMQPVCSYTDYFVVCSGEQPAPDEGDLGRGARAPEAGRRHAAPRRLPARPRRPGSWPTISTSSCTSSRPKRASSTGLDDLWGDVPQEALEAASAEGVPPLLSAGRSSRRYTCRSRAHSSAGRALAWHARGRRFEPGWVHPHWLMCAEIAGRVIGRTARALAQR